MSGPTVIISGAEGQRGEKGDTGSTGAAGAAGTVIRYGTVDPTTEGINGDFYINTTNHKIFGPKASGSWPSGVSLVGPTGSNGTNGTNGTNGSNGATGATGSAGSNGTNGADGVSSKMFDILWTSPDNGTGTMSPSYSQVQAGIPAADGGYVQSGGGASAETLKYSVPIVAGTYTVWVWYLKASNLGNMTITIDGTESSDIDCYAASIAMAKTALTFTVSTSGVKTVIVKKKGTKNGSSSDYYILWSSVRGFTT